MMHEVNMTCQIDAQLGAKTDKIRESMTLGLWFVWTIRAECEKGTNPQKKNKKIYVYARQSVHAIRWCGV